MATKAMAIATPIIAGDTHECLHAPTAELWLAGHNDPKQTARASICKLIETIASTRREDILFSVGCSMFRRSQEVELDCGAICRRLRRRQHLGQHDSRQDIA